MILQGYEGSLFTIIQTPVLEGTNALRVWGLTDVGGRPSIYENSRHYVSMLRVITCISSRITMLTRKTVGNDKNEKLSG